MVIEFAVSNFRSIKEEKSLKLASVKKFSSEEHQDNIISPDDNFYKISALKSGVIFGGNASGKSNILKAIKALNYLVKNSMDFKLDKAIKAYEPFKLCSKTNLNPVSFKLDFIAKNDIRYFYFIEFNEHNFLKEELYYYPHSAKSRKTVLFKRILGEKIEFGTYYKGRKDFEIYNNQLILSQVGLKPIESLIPPFRFFSKYLFCSTIHDTRYDDVIIQSFTKLINENSSKFRSNINKIIRASDTGITEVRTKEHSEDAFRFPEDMSQEQKEKIIEKYKHRIKTVHQIYENEKIIGEELFDLKEESTGTIKLLVIGGLILDALQDGTTIIIDELDKSLHPLLSQMLIKLFNSVENNPNNAQLIFATHDISLINRDLFRLDQLYFAEKDQKGTSNYYRLSDFTNLSKVTPLAKWYMLGRLGGVPMIDEYELSLDLTNTKDETI
jgi:AAA15 family ATPase/GTPase